LELATAKVLVFNWIAGSSQDKYPNQELGLQLNHGNAFVLPHTTGGAGLAQW